ncbi:pyridoxal-phosphate-dependent aminotransferase family protein [Tabrizicola thermarum]|uniref:pyridoxal-phosphate-dependent aminotransferase family protein n=1 Tax=Tabrizicola thermarum TaxID=2670345 RepID=UPI000FFC2987|nr:aminotransferase class V-fold PLP-dependent enzyme [Tabrizicola thermarum]
MTFRPGLNHLYIPGPTNVPDTVRMAMNVPQQDQRGPEFGTFVLSILSDLKPIFGTTRGRVMLFPGSGTSAWEAAIVNTLSPGDRVLMARHGHFSTLWARMAMDLGLDVELVDLAWGAGTPANEFARRLGADREGRIKAVFVTHNETATGVTSDVAAVRRALDTAFHDALLFVDGVSSIGSIPFLMDDWGVDLAVTGSQKGLMAPAGLGILGVSEKAMAASRGNGMVRSFLKFEDYALQTETGYFPHTPPTPVLHGLREALNRINREGLHAVFARHARLAAGIRAGVAAWGLETCAEHHSLASNTVTAIRTPAGIDAREVIRIGLSRYNTSFGSGLAQLAGKVFRIGHLGDLNEGMCLTALAVAELSLRAAGARVELGSGVAAAQSVYEQDTRVVALAAE